MQTAVSRLRRTEQRFFTCAGHSATRRGMNSLKLPERKTEARVGFVLFGLRSSLWDSVDQLISLEWFHLQKFVISFFSKLFH